jgi:hypothetical protein
VQLAALLLPLGLQLLEVLLEREVVLVERLPVRDLLLDAVRGGCMLRAKIGQLGLKVSNRLLVRGLRTEREERRGEERERERRERERERETR